PADDRGVDRRGRSVEPRQRERVRVRRVDLLQRAVVTPRVVAVIRGPGVSRRLKQPRGLERTLCGERHPCQKYGGESETPGSHERYSSPSMSPRSFARPVARLFWMNSARPMTGTVTSPNGRSMCPGHAFSNVSPDSSVRTSIRPGATPIW